MAVVDAGGFRAASDQLHISPAAVSHQINRLEDEIGYPLFVRRRGHAGGLTQQGVDAYRDARDLLDHAGTFERKAGMRGRSAVGRLRVLASPVLDELLAKHVAVFASSHPTIDVVLRISSFEEMVDSLGSRRADIAYFYTAGPVKELRSELVWREPVCICARFDHPVFVRRTLTYADLRAYAFVSAPSGTHFRRCIDALLRQHGMDKYETIMETGHPNVAREAVINGSAISAVFERHLNDNLTRHGVRQVPIRGEPLFLEVHRATRPDMILDRVTTALTRAMDCAPT